MNWQEYLVMFSIYNYLLLPDVQVSFTWKYNIFYLSYLSNDFILKTRCCLKLCSSAQHEIIKKPRLCWIIRFSLMKEHENDRSFSNIVFEMPLIIFTVSKWKTFLLVTTWNLWKLKDVRLTGLQTLISNKECHIKGITVYVYSIE